MQIRCYNCQKPFMLSKDFLQAALEQIQAENLHHVDAPCPHCRRVNKLSPEEIKRALPEWPAHHENHPAQQSKPEKPAEKPAPKKTPKQAGKE